MKALALVLCLALPVWAQEAPQTASDAPVVPVLVLEAGQAAPGRGLFLSEPQAIAQAKRVSACEAERDSLKANLGVPVWVVVAVGVIAAGGAAAVTYAAVKK